MPGPPIPDKWSFTPGWDQMVIHTWPQLQGQEPACFPAFPVLVTVGGSCLPPRAQDLCWPQETSGEAHGLAYKAGADSREVEQVPCGVMSTCMGQQDPSLATLGWESSCCAVCDGEDIIIRPHL